MSHEVSIEAFAGVRARLDAEEPLGAVVAGEGIDEETWSGIQQEWLARLSEALDRG